MVDTKVSKLGRVYAWLHAVLAAEPPLLAARQTYERMAGRIVVRASTDKKASEQHITVVEGAAGWLSMVHHVKPY